MDSIQKSIIKFNFIPEYITVLEKKYTLFRYILLSIISVWIVFIGIFAYYYIQNIFVQSDISDLAEQKQELQKKLISLKRIEKEINVLNNKVQLIDEINKNKTNWAQIIDQLNLAIPTNIWIEDLKNKNKSITVEGLAGNSLVISDFIDALESKDIFSNVRLELISNKNVNRKTYNTFRLAFTIE